MLPAQQILGLPAPPAVWQNHQAATMYPGSEYAAPAQVPSWNPSAQAGTPTYMSVAGTFPGQSYPPSSIPAYATAPTPAGSSPLSQPPMVMTQPGVQPGRPAGASPPGHPPYYVR